jgi:hypothetical protein
MRTTVTLEPDVAEQVRDLARIRRTSFEETLNDVLRCGLRTEEDSGKAPPFKVHPHRGGFRPGVEPDKLSEATDDLETDDFAKEAEH